MNRTVLTIGREYGSGGRLIASSLAELLDIPFYDKSLIEMAAKESGLSQDFISKAEQKRGSFLYDLYFSSQNLPIADQVFIAESDVIKRVAEEGPCVIVGRCGNYVLRDHPDCLHVFIHAPMDQRIRQAAEYDGAADESAVRRRDKARASYYNHFTSWRWGESQRYDITINSGLGMDVAVETIRSLYMRKGKES